MHDYYILLNKYYLINVVPYFLADYASFLPLSSQVTMVHKEYEEKIKGLMPVELRQELEDTISSLKAQVRFDLIEAKPEQERCVQSVEHLIENPFIFFH